MVDLLGKLNWFEKLVMIILMIVMAVMLTIFIRDKLDKRPFKFEDFKTSEELKTFLEMKFPIGSDVMPPYNLLIDMGARCRIVSKYSQLPGGFENYDFIGWCDYTTSLFSFDPMQHHLVIVLGNDKNEIVEFFIAKHFSMNF